MLRKILSYALSPLLALPFFMQAGTVLQENFDADANAAKWNLVFKKYEDGNWYGSRFLNGKLALEDFAWQGGDAVAVSPKFTPCRLFEISFEFSMNQAGGTKDVVCDTTLELLDSQGNVIGRLPWRVNSKVPGSKLPGDVFIEDGKNYQMKLATLSGGRVMMSVGEKDGTKAEVSSVIHIPQDKAVAQLRFTAVPGWDGMGMMYLDNLSVKQLSTPASHEFKQLGKIENDLIRLNVLASGDCDLYQKIKGQWVWQGILRHPELPDIKGPCTFQPNAMTTDAPQFQYQDVQGIAGSASVQGSNCQVLGIAVKDADGKPAAVMQWALFPEMLRLRVFAMKEPDGKNGTPEVRMGFLPAGILESDAFSAPVRTVRTNGEPEQYSCAMVLRFGEKENYLTAGTAAGLSQFYEKNEFHLPLLKYDMPWQASHYRATLAFSFRQDKQESRMDTVCFAADERIMLDMRTEDPFYLTDKPGTIKVTAHVMNAFRDTRPVTLEYRAVDFDGKIVTEGSIVRNVPAYKIEKMEIPVAVKESGPVWIEATASHQYSADYQRICVGLLKPADCKGDESTRLGVAIWRNNAPEHTEYRAHKQMFALMKRVGVHYLRQQACDPKEAVKAGFEVWFHNNPFNPDDQIFWDAKAWHTNVEERKKWLAFNLETTKNNWATTFEFNNEWNRHGFPKNKEIAVKYVKDWLIPLDQVRKEKYPEIKLAGACVSNADTEYMQVMYENGAWDHFDYFVFHDSGMPRSPDSPDFCYWNFLQTLMDVRKALRTYGEKPAYITEFYSPTAPNISCSNNERLAAADILLEIALCNAANVKGMMYYGFDDFDWNQPIQHLPEMSEPACREKYFGLIRRDYVPKALLWTFATAADTFDGATFKGDLELKGTKSYGLLFDSPKGPFAVMWSRIDGYMAHETKMNGNWHPAPWRKIFSSQEHVIVNGNNVTVTDIVGRTRSAQMSDGKAELYLTGEPVIVRGLKETPVNGYFSKMLK